MSYRFVDETSETVSITVDGEPVRLPAGRSLLAGMAAAGLAPAFFCAIGQCQRCVVWVNGRPELACLTTPQAGDDVRTQPAPPVSDPRQRI